MSPCTWPAKCVCVLPQCEMHASAGRMRTSSACRAREGATISACRQSGQRQRPLVTAAMMTSSILWLKMCINTHTTHGMWGIQELTGASWSDAGAAPGALPSCSSAMTDSTSGTTKACWTTCSSRRRMSGPKRLLVFLVWTLHLWTSHVQVSRLSAYNDF